MQYHHKREAEKLVEAVRSKYNLPTDARVPVEELAKHLGITVSRRPLLRDARGTSTVTAGEPEIVVEPDLHEPRARFTIAHEIAHLLVDSSVLDGPAATKVSASSPGEIEGFCHNFAAKLLVPTEAIEEVSEWSSLTIRKVAKRGSELGVGVEPTLRRVLEVAQGDGGLLLFDRVDGVNHDRPFKLQRGVFPSMDIHAATDSTIVIPYASEQFQPLLDAYEEGTEQLIQSMSVNLSPFPKKKSVRTAVRARSYTGQLLIVLVPSDISWETLCKTDTIVNADSDS
ncbi:ImmA/IrrE family metallo-endopeptidase [Halorubrum sp. GN11GM_10-3_MGM]|uniref:ImmA/IrrE family metallo-endopeptidase n=1 Tax=Halorubrum sp. GN11GM_10-3_MGM TaxID=2518111 RepID=UPI0010F8BC98|nr:ImmA/IrrE family metallo-endopeptidase [Halorubrum sp. GN11GM_10-3_MGM]TKX72397.1 ImmA/IrrE family metallo-endopeptidase [Halorubrum sp. GN11GM_10-3_MGM]